MNIMFEFFGLIFIPLIAALVLLVGKNDRLRTVVTIIAAVLIMACSVWVGAIYLFQPGFKLAVPGVLHEVLSYVALTIDLLLCVYIIAKGIYHHKWLAVVLSAIQLVLAGWFELGLAGGVEITTDLYIDQLSAIMVLIIGIIGTLICIYALGYMKDFQAHLTHQEIPADMEGEHTSEPKQRKDRRNIFFSIMFAFLAGMFALVLSNNLTWLLCAWEVTTVCSFALIGYTRTPEAIRNSFRQITLNLVGGLAFAAALVALVLGAKAAGATPILELDKLISAGSVGSSGLFLLLPIALLCVAGFTKAAQVPFQSWLLGAMVAPTPTSALLHSSTMVKAGVFLLIKLAPCLGFDFNGMMVMLVGGITFLFCSAVAIAQTNAKRVLAYSTIANLGLIVLCAGIGTPEGTWAAIFLLIFHACAKALLFCCVGTAEHHIGSRQIELMDNLFIRMPKLAVMMALGMFIMFVAPFGMLISKWATIASLAETQNVALLLILAFGSALTFVFWAKWLGKVLAIGRRETDVEHGVNKTEWTALLVMAIIAALLCVLFPFISNNIVMPYLTGVATTLASNVSGFWNAVAPAISLPNLLIMAVLVLLVFVAFAIQFLRVRKYAAHFTDVAEAAPLDTKERYADVYLSGIGTDFQMRSFKDAFGKPMVSAQRNWYMGNWFGDDIWTTMVNVICIIVMVAGVVVAALGCGSF